MKALLWNVRFLKYVSYVGFTEYSRFSNTYQYSRHGNRVYHYVLSYQYFDTYWCITGNLISNSDVSIHIENRYIDTMALSVLGSQYVSIYQYRNFALMTAIKEKQCYRHIDTTYFKISFFNQRAQLQRLILKMHHVRNP